MSGIGRKFTAAAVAMSLVAVPTAAIGAAPAAPASMAAPANPWITLSAMTTGSSAASTAAAQDGYDDGGIPIFPLVVMLATIAVAVYILVKDDDGGRLEGLPISPS